MQHCVYHVRQELMIIRSRRRRRCYYYLDRAITGTKASNERSPAFIRGIHTDSRAGPRVAGFFDAALDVCGAGAVTCEAESLGCAVGCVLTCAVSILSLHTQENKQVLLYIYRAQKKENGQRRD